MCGIAGLIHKTHLTEKNKQSFIDSSWLMKHRGPDNTGFFQNENLIFVHHRLSVIDLEPRSNQPFFSKDNKFVTVYNGELYNYKELKNHFKISTKTNSDTEIMLESFILDKADAVRKWNGIFASAIYDIYNKKLFLIRDRFGVKPLYIYEDEQALAFASEAKVILNWLYSFSINPLGLSQYLWYGNTTGEQTILDNLKKIPPGTISEIDLRNFSCLTHKYWDLKNIHESYVNDKEATENVKIMLDTAVKRQLVSDVPVGVLLSGGIDSSAIVAYASKHYQGKLDTYTVEYDYNISGKSELEKAKIIANKYNTIHNELYVNSNDVLNIFSDLVFQYDEPFADPASIPLYQIARACSSDKKVILQGDGGDELFAGYRRYNVLDWFWLWKIASLCHMIIPHKRWRERMKRLAFVLWQPNDALIMSYYLTQDVPYKNPLKILSQDWYHQLSVQDYFIDYFKADYGFKDFNKVQKQIFTDTAILLPNTYLEKVDKATMKCSIESRVPFLDNVLTEYVLSLPSKLKVKHGQKKYLLKKVLKGIIPDEILNAPKRGFDVPYRKWLKTDLYEFAKESFLNSKIDILNSGHLIALLDVHKNNIADYGPLLWKSLILSHWLNIYNFKIKW